MHVRMRDRVAECAMSFGWLGKMPLASGTWGTLGAVVVHAIVVNRIWLKGSSNPWIFPVLAGVCTLVCVALGPWAERFYGKKDPGQVVIDEVAGYFLAISFFPHANQLWMGMEVFFLFRLFDVLKPFPARRSQRLPAGVGIVVDDLIAGVYAAGLTWVLFRPQVLWWH